MKNVQLASTSAQAEPIPKIVLRKMRFTGETGQKAFVRLTLSILGKSESTQKMADGVLDAAFAAINEIVPNHVIFKDYQVKSVTLGTNALARVTITVSEHDREIIAEGSHQDTVCASVDAYIAALNRLRA